MGSIIFTKEGLDKIRTELEELKAQRPDAVGHLKRARELGDLSENGYYKASRAKLSFIDSRLRHLKHLIDNAKIVAATTGDTVEVGKKVTVSDGDTERTFFMVGGFESNPSEGKISHQSPLGKALMGARVGETRIFNSPNGEKKYRVIKLEV